MSNALVKAAGNKGLAALMDEASAFGAAASEMNVNIGGLLSFSGNTGEFKYKGQIIEHGTVVAVDPSRMRKGWVCWKGGKPIEKHVTDILGGERIKTQAELPDYGPFKEGEGWMNCAEVPVTLLDTNEQVDISLSSKGGVNALLRLGQDWSSKSKMNLDENGDRKQMLVELGAVSFTSDKAAGKKWAPTFKIVEWVSIAEAEAYDDDAAYVEEEPVKEEPKKVAAPAANRPGFRPGTRGQRT